MATATYGETLEGRLRNRWTAAAVDGRHPNVIGTGDDIVEDALAQLLDEMIGVYRIREVSEFDRDGALLGAPWLEALERAAKEAGMKAWADHVIPVVAANVAAYVRRSPEWLRAHPEGTHLREDAAIGPFDFAEPVEVGR